MFIPASGMVNGNLDITRNATDDGYDYMYNGATASSVGILAAVGFGSTPNLTAPHLIIEIELPVLDHFFIFSGPSTGPNGTWTANLSNDLVDPPASAAIFEILPDGTTIANSIIPGLENPVPEPSTVFAGAALAGLCLTRFLRKR